MKKETLFAVRLFRSAMIKELRNNQRKGDILEWEGLESKIVDLEYHKAKLLIAIRQKNKFAIREYMADCANILMSIAHECGALEMDDLNTEWESVMIGHPIVTKPISFETPKHFLDQ